MSGRSFTKEKKKDPKSAAKAISSEGKKRKSSILIYVKLNKTTVGFLF